MDATTEKLIGEIPVAKGAEVLAVPTVEDMAETAAAEAAVAQAKANDAADKADRLARLAMAEAVDKDGLANAMDAHQHAMDTRRAPAWLAAARAWKLAPRGR